MLDVFEVTDADMAFPSGKNIPKREDIPEEFWNGNTKWNEVFNQWFFRGGKASNVKPKEGVDKKKAIRAIKSVIGSFEPSHEHKEAAVAYMLSEWFEEFEISQD